MARIRFSGLFLLLFVSACIPYRQIDIEYYDSSTKISIPNGNGKVLILTNYQDKSLSSRGKTLAWALDSVAATEATLSLAKVLNSSPAFSQTSFSNYSVYRKDTSNMILPLPWTQLKNLSEINDSAGLILSLDYMNVKPTAGSYTLWQGSVNAYHGYIYVPVYCYWRIYDITNQKIANYFLHRDTLVWEADDWREVKPGDQLPGYFAAVAYSGADAAEKFAAQIAPFWENSTRILYNSGSKQMVEAEKLALKGDWRGAAEIWQQVIKKGGKALPSRAAFNMALANEMLGNFNVSLEWLMQAKHLNPNLEGLNDYMEIINYRIKANSPKP